MEEWLSVGEAASKLGVSQPHLRRLLRAGLLHSERVGKTWLVHAGSVRDRGHFHRHAGRPVSPLMVWSFAWLLQPRSEWLAAAPSPDAAMGDRQQRYRLRQMLEHAPAPTTWAFWLRRRAEPHRYWVHPAVLGEIDGDPRLHPSSVESAVGNSVEPAERWYIRERELHQFVSQRRARSDPAGQLRLMAIPESVAESLRPSRGQPVPKAIALVDLLESAAARDREVAVGGLEKLLAEARSSW